MSVIDGLPLIRKYELGEEMTPDEKELLTGALYFYWRSQNEPAIKGLQLEKEGTDGIES